MSTIRRLQVAMVAACLTVGLATPAQGHAVVAKHASVKTLDKRLRATRKSVRKLGLALGNATERLGVAERSLAAVVATAPGITAQLQSLAATVRDELRPSVATVTTGLQRLSDASAASEYGAAIVRFGPAAGPATASPTLVTSDIPDSGSSAGQSVQVPVNLTTAPAQADPVVIDMRAAIRSAEADGAATGDPAGQAGALMTVTCGGGTCRDGAASPNTFPVGGIVCVSRTPPKTFGLPAGGTITQPLVNLQQGVALTDLATPGLGTTATLLPGPSSGSSPCTVRIGGVYLVNATVQFADLPTSASPGPRD